MNTAMVTLTMDNSLPVSAPALIDNVPLYTGKEFPSQSSLLTIVIHFRGLVQSPCGKISVIMTLGGEGVLVHDVMQSGRDSQKGAWLTELL